MKVSYFPGCTLKTSGKNFEDSAVASARILGIDMVELPRWNCCGTVYSLTSDDLMHNLGPLRNLLRVQEQGDDRVVTLCSMCYNTLKRANDRIRANPDELEKLNQFMYKEETSYRGGVRVEHYLTLLRDHVGFAEVSRKVKRPLHGLKLAAYYGCTLLRPADVAIDDPETPTILEDLLGALGAAATDFPHSTECCASYQVVSEPDLVVDRTYEIVSSARRSGADAIVTSCPLCDYNLGRYQTKVRDKYAGFAPLPTLYFTQVLAVALGVDEKECQFDLNYVDPRPLFEAP
jgi:heterodisulfide reductase subunit B